ncbi:MAG: ferredoxin [Thermoplasmatota archaeon]
MKQPVVDSEACIGCGVCAHLCPGVFEIVDEISRVKDPGACASCDCQEAIDTCPVDAISWRDTGA